MNLFQFQYGDSQTAALLHSPLSIFKSTMYIWRGSIWWQYASAQHTKNNIYQAKATVILSKYDPQLHPAGSLAPATIRERFIAQLIDSLILWLPCFLTLFFMSGGQLRSFWVSPIVPQYLIEVSGIYQPSSTAFLWGGSIFTFHLPSGKEVFTHYPAPVLWIIYIAYYSVMHSLFGQTIGQRAKHLVVLDESHQRLALSTSILRWMYYLISILPFGIGLIGAEEGKSLHDRLAKSRVYRYHWDAGL